MYQRIRRLGRRIRNLWRWLPVIWQDEDFDHAFLARIIAFKARLMAQHFEEYQAHVGWEREARQLRMVAYLMGDGREKAGIAMGDLCYVDDPDGPLGLRHVGSPMADRAFATVDERYTRYAFEIMRKYFLHWWC